MKDLLTIQNNAAEEFDTILNVLSSFRLQVTILQTQLRHLDKKINSQLKKNAINAKNTQLKKKRSPSGFALPVHITKELCIFMNKSIDTKVARTDVTQYIISYIKNNKLQDESNMKHIIPDIKLFNLLQPPDGEQLTFFNIQRYMNRHFIKNKQ
jgi:chromatin remodeling complex protein RSC6